MKDKLTVVVGGDGGVGAGIIYFITDTTNRMNEKTATKKKKIGTPINFGDTNNQGEEKKSNTLSTSYVQAVLSSKKSTDGIVIIFSHGLKSLLLKI